MSGESDSLNGSITCWIGDLKSGGTAAAQPLWDRYFTRLVQLARGHLRRVRTKAVVEDEEDAALSAFESFCDGITRGRFSSLCDRDDLWRLLVVITIRKVQDQLERARAAKRGGGKVVSEAALMLDGDSEEAGLLDLLTGDEPGPELAAMVAEEYRLLHDRLANDTLRQVLDLRLEGYTRDEIAARLGCAQRTVARKLEIIRQEWLGDEA